MTPQREPTHPVLMKHRMEHGRPGSRPWPLAMAAIGAGMTFFIGMTANAPRAAANGIIIVAPSDQVTVKETPTDHPDGRVRPHPPIMPPRRHPPRPIQLWQPFGIKSQQVDVIINDAAAETAVEQVFVNNGPRPAEGTYLFAVADNAAVHNFTMWMNGREVTAELLDADKARQIYQSIVAKMRDPALLEYVGRGLIRASVFPIPPGGECRIKLRYSEPVQGDAGMCGYRFPLRAEECGNQAIEHFSLKAAIRSSRPISSVFSPSHQCSIDRRSDREVVVGLEQANLSPDRDFQLLFKGGEEALGLMLLSYRAGDGDGYFLARIAPRLGDESTAAMPKNICFVLDTSGSMAEDNKIIQAKKALNFCLTNLGREDRFSLINFSTEVRRFRDDWAVADQASLAAARAFVDNLQAVGGTDIDGAIKQALAMNPAGQAGGSSSTSGEAWRRNPYFIVFVTDGQPTVGITDPVEILKNIAAANGTKSARVFVLGVGYQVNAKLLDRMADDNGGARDYVSPSEDLELKLSAFYTKLANPVLAGLKLLFKGVAVSDAYPREMPDLFKGSELEVVGRYSPSGGDGSEIELTGTSRGEPRTYRYNAIFGRQQTDNDYLPRLWAMRKIGFLLDELRLHGENKELKDEVIRLSKQHGIMTPYTSYLVQEDVNLGVRYGRPLSAVAPAERAVGEIVARRGVAVASEARDQEASFGGGAVGASLRNLGMARASAEKSKEELGKLTEFSRDEAGNRTVNYVGAKTFYRDGERWLDSEYDGQKETIKLVAGGKDYDEFLAANPAAARYLAQGDRVVLCWKGRVYETVPSDT